MHHMSTAKYVNIRARDREDAPESKSRPVARATVRDLRYNFPKIERALRAGREIEITKHSKVIARIVPQSETPQLPDFLGRMREIFGDKIMEVSGAEIISEMREGR